MKTLTQLGIKLVTFDMAGTTVYEGGLVYSTLKEVMTNAGVPVPEEEFEKWHGANKKEVIAHFVQKAKKNPTMIEELFKSFDQSLQQKYLDPECDIKVMDGVIQLFDSLRAHGILVCLNTGFPRSIANHIINKLGFEKHIDGSITAEEVGLGRPYPYMIHQLMRQHKILSVEQVAKVGDTTRDVEEGLNAGCGLVVAVLSGADSKDVLEKANPHLILEKAADLRL